VNKTKQLARQILSTIKNAMVGIRCIGTSRTCSVCGGSARCFLPQGVDQRPDARCPWCHSVERHRLVWRFFQSYTNLFDGAPKKVLRVAPEACFESRLRKQIGSGYLTADLLDDHVMEKMDITDIHYPDSYFDVIYCSHVLEHVPDDRQARAEFFRVLSPSGWAVILVPITVDHTVEDPSITDPQERLRRFGQEDHVRRYGVDYEDRLDEAGFAVQRLTPMDIFAADEIERYGVSKDEAGDIYYCTKTNS